MDKHPQDGTELPCVVNVATRAAPRRGVHPRVCVRRPQQPCGPRYRPGVEGSATYMVFQRVGTSVNPDMYASRSFEAILEMLGRGHMVQHAAFKLLSCVPVQSGCLFSRRRCGHLAQGWSYMTPESRERGRLSSSLIFYGLFYLGSLSTTHCCLKRTFAWQKTSLRNCKFSRYLPPIHLPFVVPEPRNSLEIPQEEVRRFSVP
ncbi:hypothetical protein B0T16DRAFT_152438 [Cercophora newfieldiana]|uniref:Uncharacterized protein n=1 Tax=Cercophora newfieldiana TaxID=92897 RepID=A0AA40CPB6_9PEZI|nr:hypothetical protein B0T16DRAFT_152438 [Cercophora newfieldiana]